jgi:hypothetical protein
VPVIAVAADKNWKERITLVGNKDALGNPINLTEVYYSTLGIVFKIELSAEGLPSVVSDQAGNKVVFTNLTASTVDVTFFDQEGGANAGPTTIPIDPARFAALRNTYAAISQGQIPAGSLAAISRNDLRIWLPFASDAISATICAGGLVAALPTGGTSFAFTAGSCLLTAGLIAGISDDPAFQTIESHMSILETTGDLLENSLDKFNVVGLVANLALEYVAPAIINTWPPAKPTWFGSGILPKHDYILLAWRGSESDSGIQGYLIIRDDNTTFQTTSGHYRDYTVTPGSHYCYRVQAYKAPNRVNRWSDISDPRCATVPMIAPPLVITGTATNITPSSVTLNGSVNPNGSATSANFEYGTSAAYGNTTLAQAVGNGTSLINLTENLSNLVPNTTYHYRVVARNSEGSITPGSDQTFRSVVPVTGAPTISSVSPGTVTGSNSAQPFTINGSNFVTGARVTLRDKRTGEVFPNRQPSSFTNTSITLNPVFTTASGTWSVNVVNPDNSSTGEYVFSVVAPTGVPLSFASLSPSVVETNAIGHQPALTVSGSNFNNVRHISFDWTGVASGNSTWIRGDINWLRKVTVNSDGSMTLRPVVTDASDPAGITNWRVTLTDTAGMTATQTFTVNYTPTTSLNFISPSLGTINTSAVGYQPTLTASGNVTQVSVSWSGTTSGSETWVRNDPLWLSRVTSNPDGSMTLRPVVTRAGDPAGITNWTVTIRDNTGATRTQSFSVNYTPAAGSPTPPTIPANLTPGSLSSPGPTLGSSAVTVSWNASSEATSYIGGITDLAAGSDVVTINTSGISTAATLSPGRQYRWYVFACNSSGCSSSSALYYFQTPAATGTTPATPTGTTPGSTASPGPTTSSTTVGLSWSAVSGATSYGLAVRDLTTNTFAVDTTVSGTAHTATLSAGRQYRWDVRACNSAGCSAFSTDLYFQTPAATGTTPATPTGISPGSTTSPGPTLGSTTVGLSWSAVSGATSYSLGVRSIATGVLVVDSIVNGTSFNVGLAAATQYRWNVAACNSAGCSNFSPVLFFQTPGTVLVTPTSLSPGSTISPGPTLGSSAVTVSWNASSGATSYIGGITDIAAGSDVVTINTSGTSTAATLSPGRQYRWYVFACNSSGCSSSSALYYFRTP